MRNTNSGGKVEIPGFDNFENAAMSDYSFNTTDNGSKTAAKVKTNQTAGEFILKHSVGALGNKKRRAAEFILSTDKKYFQLDYSGSAQKKWSSEYNKQTNTKK